MSSKPPKGTAHRRKFVVANGADEKTPHSRLHDEDLKDFRQNLANTWGFQPREYQMEGIIAQLKQEDVLIHAGTGMGKTAVAAGPHVHASCRGKVTLMVSPLIALHDEMSETFRDEFNLTVTAVNSSNGGCAPDKLKKIVAGEWQIILISPEQLLTRRFIQNVLKDSQFKRKLISVVIDEAHVLSHWGSGFRKKYGELGMLRSFLLKSTSIVALSATMPPRIRRDILRILRFDKKNFVNIDMGNDRPNVSIVVRGIHHPIKSYADLDFIINPPMQTPCEIPKTFIYCDNIAMGTEIIDHLMERLPVHLHLSGIIRPYNSCFSKDYRKAVMQEFREGKVRILVCTDAAGMGCNIPDIDLVVQWKVPGSISAFVQRAGRCARAAGRVGLAVLLVEQSVYSTMLNEHGNKPVKVKSKPGATTASRTSTDMPHAGLQPSKDTLKARKNYAIARGGRRGSENLAHDAILVRDCPPIDEEADDEGLYSFVQSGTCRRSVLATIYGNKHSNPTVPCCDICDPSLLNKTRPGHRTDAAKSSRVKVGLPCSDTLDKLHDWRMSVKRRDFKNSLFSADALLPDRLVELLASIGPIPTRARLSLALGGMWGWEKTYGSQLFDAMSAMNIRPLVCLPARRRAPKRGHSGEDVEGQAVRKRKPDTEPEETAFLPGIPKSCQFSFQINDYKQGSGSAVGRNGEFSVRLDV